MKLLPFLLEDPRCTAPCFCSVPPVVVVSGTRHGMAVVACCTKACCSGQRQRSGFKEKCALFKPDWRLASPRRPHPTTPLLRTKSYAETFGIWFNRLRLYHVRDIRGGPSHPRWSRRLLSWASSAREQWWCWCSFEPDLSRSSPSIRHMDGLSRPLLFVGLLEIALVNVFCSRLGGWVIVVDVNAKVR